MAFHQVVTHRGYSIHTYLNGGGKYSAQICRDGNAVAAAENYDKPDEATTRATELVNELVSAELDLQSYYDTMSNPQPFG